MNKHIINVLKDTDFTFNGGMGYGHINGYEVNVIENKMGVGPIFVIATYLSQIKKNEFISKLNSHKFKMVTVDSSDFGFSIMIGAMTASSFEKKYNDVMPVILSLLEELEAPKANICPQSGEEIDSSNSKTIEIEKVKLTLSNKSIEAINSSIGKELDDYKEAPNNYLKGLLGLLIGALAGVALSIILYFVGFISAFSAVLSILLGTFLYVKFGGKKNVMMIVLSFIVTTVSLLLAILGLYLFVANGLVEIANLTLFEKFEYCLEIEEFKKGLLTDIGLNLLFIFVGEALSIARLRQIIKKPTKIEA